MALRMSMTTDMIKVVPKIDDAVGEKADYERYLETNDEVHLDLQPGVEPTRFVLRRVLPFDLARRVEDAQMTIGGVKDAEGGGEVDVKVNPSYVLEEVRCALAGIENPPGMPADECVVYKAAPDGGADPALIAHLRAAGLVMPLFRALKAQTKGADGKRKK